MFNHSRSSNFEEKRSESSKEESGSSKQLFRLIWRSLSQDYAIKLVDSLGNAKKLLIMKATRQFINNKTSRFVLCSMCVFFFSALPQIVFGFRRTLLSNRQYHFPGANRK